MTHVTKTDVAIIGGGPIGIYSALQAGLFNMKSCVIESLPTVGGQCIALYPEKPIYDIPAHKMILAKDLISKLEEQVKQHNPTYILEDTVTYLEGEEGNFILRTQKSKKIHAKVIIIAVGCGKFTPLRPLQLANCEKFENKSIFYFVKDKSVFKDKRIAIAGGGDAAIDWALTASQLAKKVYVIHRRDNFRCIPSSLSRLKEISEKTNEKVEFITPYQISKVRGEEKSGTLNTVVVSNVGDQEKIKSLEIDMLLPCFGMTADIGDIKEWNLELSPNKQRIFVDFATSVTSKSGIYAIGDIAFYDGKVKSIISGFAEAARACKNAYCTINPDDVRAATSENFRSCTS